MQWQRIAKLTAMDRSSRSRSVFQKQSACIISLCDGKAGKIVVLVPAYVAINSMEECLTNIAYIGSWIMLIDNLKFKSKMQHWRFAYEAIEKVDSTPCGKSPWKLFTEKLLRKDTPQKTLSDRYEAEYCHRRINMECYTVIILHSIWFEIFL